MALGHADGVAMTEAALSLLPRSQNYLSRLHSVLTVFDEQCVAYAQVTECENIRRQLALCDIVGVHEA